jgi:hypothetical protein
LEQHHENKAFDNGHLLDSGCLIGGSDVLIFVKRYVPALIDLDN